MFDPRYKELAELLVKYSCHIQPGENVLIEQRGNDDALVKELLKEVIKAGGRPQFRVWPPELERVWIRDSDKETMELASRIDTELMKEMDAYIGIRQYDNLYTKSDVSAEANKNYDLNYYAKVHFPHRVNDTKWVVLRYPNHSMAQLAEMPTDQFEDFYFRVCNFNYEQMSKAMDPLKNLLDNADQVHIKGEGVDLRFSIKGIGSVKCDGRMNIPDGEVYTAPVKDSVEGYITYNTPSPNSGKVYDAVHLEFSKGKIVKASCANGLDKELEAIFDTDEGARYVGEFAFGVHPHITKPMKDILFDEKISGSFHFTPGASYEDAFNGNESAVHWDMVYIMRPEYGGCEIYIDGELIQKDGRFVREDLLGLNPENLSAALEG